MRTTRGRNSLSSSVAPGAPGLAGQDPTAAPRQGRPVGISPIARVPKVSQQVAGQIRRLILDGELADGDQLPPETQLAVDFRVSRPTVREAYRILETEGLIEVARGSRTGARVNTPSIETSARYAAFALRGVGATLAETYDAQLAIEPYAVRLLAERRPAAAIAELEQGLLELEALTREGRIPERSVALARYHLLIVRLTGNRTLSVMAEMLAKILEVHQGRYQAPPEVWANARSEREFRNLGPRSIRKLLELIEAGDADGAEAHWRLHVKNSAAYWLVGADPATVIDVED
ncbi:MAG: FadR family transcriptional regulator [Phenylobacterium sp.]|nr:FadR family transcriptional regulator [Phenylobacterium sp.]